MAEKLSSANRLTQFVQSKLSLHKKNKTSNKLNTIKNKNTKSQCYDEQQSIKPNTTNNPINSVTLDNEKRIIFISLFGFYQSWKQCPTITLFRCLLLIPIKRIWIYKARKYSDEWLQFGFQPDGGLFQQFIKLLKVKDSQKSIFYMLEHYQYDEKYHHIGPFWLYFSKRLENMYDSAQQKNYSPLIFDEKFWKSRNVDVINEYCLFTMKFKCIKEIISTSNGSSLIPVINYNEILNPEINVYKIDETLNNDDDDEEGDWFISCDYDPNDLDNGCFFCTKS